MDAEQIAQHAADAVRELIADAERRARAIIAEAEAEAAQIRARAAADAVDAAAPVIAEPASRPPAPAAGPPPAPAPAAPEPAAAALGDPSEGAARLIALKMALDGASQEEIDAHLAANYELADRARVVAEVLAKAGR